MQIQDQTQIRILVLAPQLLISWLEARTGLTGTPRPFGTSRRKIEAPLSRCP